MDPVVGIFALLVAIGVFILIYGMQLKAKRDERRAGLYEKALDKGLDPREIKFDLDQKELGDPYGNLKAGVILLAVAVALIAGMWMAEHLRGAFRLLVFALVPAAIGLAVLFLHFTLPRKPPE
ncbi:hypothetical protein JW859_01955 [bacterium]|nr:hypothetical protein [bacterium]